jgi:hypothetical protein
MARAVDTEKLSDESLALLDDAIRKGQFTLSTGKLLTLEADQIIRVAQWVVQNLKTKKPRFVADTSELGLRPTRRTADDAT